MKVYVKSTRVATYDDIISSSEIAEIARNQAYDVVNAYTPSCPFPVGFSFCMGELYGAAGTQVTLMQRTYPGTTWERSVNSSDYYVTRKS